MVVARVLLGAMTLRQTELMRNGRVVLNYLSEPLENTLDGNAIDALVPAAAEQRRLAKMDVDRIAAEKQTAIREENARAFEQKRLADSAKVKSLSLLPRGYKDVCDFEPSGVAYVFYGDQTETYELVCVNSGSVPGLAKLKEAGFIVTNISERTSGSRASSRFNVEKIR